MKEFNTTGVCIPEKHYMVDISEKLAKIEKMVEKGRYFTINRPRQTGKTTTIYLLTKELIKKDYFVLKMSFEAKSTKIFTSEKRFIKSFLKEIERNIKFRVKKNKEKLLSLIKNKKDFLDNLSELSYLITDLVLMAEKEVVLIINEVDKSTNNQLFLDFLGILRNKYLLREQSEDKTFRSVILAGVHDVKNLKLKLRPDEERKYNSPWNIAVEFDIDMDFNVKEIKTMLKDYKEDRDVAMNINEIAKRIHYYTSGQPFLVSKLAEIVDNKIMPEKVNNEWGIKDIDEAMKIILNQSNTNFESLVKNLENNKELYDLVNDIIIEGKRISYNLHNPVIEKGEIYGILKKDNNLVRVHNKIYEQIIYNYMTSKIETNVEAEMYNFRDNFISTSGKLNMKKVLTKFQQFIKKEYSDKD